MKKNIQVCGLVSLFLFVSIGVFANKIPLSFSKKDSISNFEKNGTLIVEKENPKPASPPQQIV